MEYTITAYVNVDRNGFFGYQAGQPIALVDTFSIKATSALHALDGAYDSMWPVGNRMASDLHGKTWPSDVRSMSTGDVAKVVTPPCHAHPHGNVAWYAAATVGWTEITEPTNIVPIEGTYATSRK